MVTDFLKITPAFAVSVGGVDITGILSSRLLELRVTDNAGVDSDTVDIKLDDRGGLIALPETGKEIRVALGYRESGLADMGKFVVAEIGLGHPPQSLSIRGTGPDMKNGLKAPKTRPWDKKTFGEIVEQIGGEHGYQGRVHPSLADIKIEHLDQTEESDLHLLTRLGDRYDAIVKPSNRLLSVVPRGESETASGAEMPVIALTPEEVTKVSVTIADRGKYKSVQAEYQDQAAGKREKCTAGDGEPKYVMRRQFPDRETCQKAADAKMKALLRGERTIQVTMPGDVRVSPECQLWLQGFRAGIDGKWLIKTVTHTVNGNGYSCQVSGEAPNAKKDKGKSK